MWPPSQIVVWTGLDVKFKIRMALQVNSLNPIFTCNHILHPINPFFTRFYQFFFGMSRLWLQLALPKTKMLPWCRPWRLAILMGVRGQGNPSCWCLVHRDVRCHQTWPGNACWIFDHWSFEWENQLEHPTRNGELSSLCLGNRKVCQRGMRKWYELIIAASRVHNTLLVKLGEGCEG